MTDDETRPEQPDPPAMDDGEDPTEYVGDFTTGDVDLSDLLGDDHQDQDEDYADELPAHIEESEADPEYVAAVVPDELEPDAGGEADTDA